MVIMALIRNSVGSLHYNSTEMSSESTKPAVLVQESYYKGYKLCVFCCILLHYITDFYDNRVVKNLLPAQPSITEGSW